MPYESRQAWIDSVRQAVDIVAVVGRHVSLKKKGRHWWGLCPFHAEKTPSFSVDAEQQLYYCFGCHQGGTVFTFLMHVEGREFRHVVESLAEEAGIPIPSDGQAPRDPYQRLRAVLEWTQEYFRENFGRHANVVKPYLQQRGTDAASVEKFQLGYAPDGWQGLIDRLKRRGVGLDEMVEAGVAVSRDQGGAYDRWRGRLMFPIWDNEGRVVAFGGRALGEGQQPKYLNSPETPLFHKGQLLYAGHLARPLWRKGKAALIVEGYFDVLACHQAGLGQAVAALGTALTDVHARYLARYCDEVDLLLDGDAAGQEAMRRAYLILAGAGLRVNRIVLPDGVKDPGEFIVRGGSKALLEAYQQKVPYVEAEIQRIGRMPGLMSPRGRAEAVKGLKPLVQAVKDPVEQAGYVELIARTLRVQPRILSQSLGVVQEVQHTIGKNRHNMEVTAFVKRSVPPLEVRLLLALKNHPDQIERVKRALPEWAQDPAIQFLLAVLQAGDAEGVAWDRADSRAESLWVAMGQYHEPDGGIPAIDDLVEAFERRETERRWQGLQERARQGDTSPELMEEIRRLSGRIAQMQVRKEG
ncbi:DNA primase [Sulfobacillus harzensis]|uniref:DNA primase n=1 Tax=Sulfobacillus harzensis TaxID=2729629 RepID=A0A7Y0L387_9FIRM|nr:DNA primase [Sulfobacillus harzensis]NMP21069.1 DNA primase [Sulfobacillus harzensis]